MTMKKLLKIFEAMPAKVRQDIARQDQAQELEFQQGRAEFNQAAQQRAAQPSTSTLGGTTAPRSFDPSQYPTSVNVKQPEVTPATTTGATRTSTSVAQSPAKPTTPTTKVGTGAAGFPIQSATTRAASTPAARTTAPATTTAKTTTARPGIDAMKGSQATAAQTQTSSYSGQDIRTATARSASSAPPTQGFAGSAADSTDTTPDTSTVAGGGFQGGGYGSVGTLSQSTMPEPASSSLDTSTAAGALAGMGRSSSTMSEDDINNDDLNEMLRLSGMNLKEKAVSKQQQKFMGMVHAMQKGEKIKGASKELKKAAQEMPKKAAKDYASTKHTGLPKRVTEDIMLDEAGNTLKHITNRFKYEVKMFMQAGVMDNNLYDALSDYYIDRGEVPYGVVKGKSGYPDMTQWVEERFYADMGSELSETAPQHDTLSELARLAGLHENKLIECGNTDMETEDRLNVSTNMSSDGTKNVNISAQGNKAEELLSMLKLAGMSGSDQPAVVVVDRDEEMMEQDMAENFFGDRTFNRVMPIVKRIAGEVSDYDRDEFGEELWSLLDQKYGSKFAQSVLQDDLGFYWNEYTELTGQGLEEERVTQYSNTPDEEYQTVASITRQGNDLNREKKQFANKPRLGDNPMATEEMLDEEMTSLLDSILIRKNDELEEGLFGDSEEELQARSPQYKQLKAMEPKYKGTQYEPQLKQRIDTARTRAEMGAGEVMDYDSKTGKQTPRAVVPPEQYKAK